MTTIGRTGRTVVASLGVITLGAMGLLRPAHHLRGHRAAA